MEDAPEAKLLGERVRSHEQQDIDEEAQIKAAAAQPKPDGCCATACKHKLKLGGSLLLLGLLIWPPLSGHGHVEMAHTAVDWCAAQKQAAFHLAEEHPLGFVMAVSGTLFGVGGLAYAGSFLVPKRTESRSGRSWLSYLKEMIMGRA